MDGTIDGPGPIVISGRLTIETFLFDISWHETFTIGSGGGDTPVTLRPLIDELFPEIGRAENVRASGGADRLVLIKPLPASSNKAVVSPLGELIWTQRRAPFGIPVDRLEGVPLGGMQAVKAQTSEPTPRVEKALFSPGSFISLSKSEALNRPAFDLLDAGFAVGWPDTERSVLKADVPSGYQLIRKVLGEVEIKVHPGAWAVMNSIVHQMIAARNGPPEVSSMTPMMDVVQEPWATNIGAKHTSTTAAQQAVRMGQGVLALPALDASRPVNLAGI